MTKTTLLLQRYYGGDDDAYGELLEKHQDWILARVRKRLGDKLRQKLESVDVMQDAILKVLVATPRFQPKDGAQFRGLVARIVENQLCDEANWFAAKRRDMDREKAIPEGSSIDLSKSSEVRTPDEAAENAEMIAHIRFVLELLSPPDRQVIVMRDWDGLSYEEIAAQLNVSYDAARMRYERAKPKIKQGLAQIRLGEFDAWLASLESDEDSTAA